MCKILHTPIVELATNVCFLLHQLPRSWLKGQNYPSYRLGICDIACIIYIFCFNKVEIYLPIVTQGKTRSPSKLLKICFHFNIMNLLWPKRKFGHIVHYIEDVKMVAHFCKLQAIDNLYIQKIMIKILNANRLESNFHIEINEKFTICTMIDSHKVVCLPCYIRCANQHRHQHKIQEF